jgi:hypothetical protein
MLEILMVLCLGMAAAFAIGPAFAGETETSPVAATSATSPNDSKTTDLARPNANHNCWASWPHLELCIENFDGTEQTAG